MKAQELRIGNYLKRLDESVFEVNSEDIQIVDRWDSNEDLLPKPIPLTEEWLLKFGFIYSRPGIGGQDQWAGFGNWYLTNDNYFSMIGTKNGECWFNRVNDWKIQYVHQLQNLYFALTGEELTAKEELT